MTKTERLVADIARMTWPHPTNRDINWYSFSSEELRAVRRFLRANKHHSESTYWLDYYRGFIPHDRPDKNKEFSLDDYDDGARFAAFCRQLLAMNGIVVSV